MTILAPAPDPTILPQLLKVQKPYKPGALQCETRAFSPSLCQVRIHPRRLVVVGSCMASQNRIHDLSLATPEPFTSTLRPESPKTLHHLQAHWIVSGLRRRLKPKL